MVLNELSNLYGKGISKIKNKKIKKLLQTDLENSLIDIGAENGLQKYFLMEEKQKNFF